MKNKIVDFTCFYSFGSKNRYFFGEKWQTMANTCKNIVNLRVFLEIAEKPCVFGEKSVPGESWRIQSPSWISLINPLENAGRARRARPMERSDK